MKERIIAVNSNTYHGFSIQDAVKGIVAAGFHAIELTATKGWTEHVFPTMSFHQLCAIRELLANHGLAVIALSGHCNLMDPQRIPDFIDNIRLADFFGARTIVSSVGEAHLKNRTTSSESVLLENLRGLLPILKQYGIQLVLETHGTEGTGTAIDKIVTALDSSSVGIAYDTANVIFYGGVKDLADLSSCVEVVRYVHLKDKAGASSEWNFPALGDGYVDIPGILGLLDQRNNSSPLSIEIEFTPETRSLETVNQAVQRSATYLGCMGYRL